MSSPTTRRLVTPAQAQEWLDVDTSQRPVKKQAVVRYARDMSTGKWQDEVAPPILLSVAGAVLDGQHRLLAQVMAGVEMMWEIRIVDPSAIVNVDTGVTRSLGDTMSVMGYAHGKEMSAHINTAYYWEFGTGSASHKMSRAEQVQWLLDNPNATKASEVAYDLGARGAKGIMRVPLGAVACLWDMAEYAEGGDSVVEFLDALQSNALDTDMATRLYRQYADAKNPNKKQRLDSKQVGLMVVRVYGAWLMDEDVQRLYARRNAVHQLPGYGAWSDANWGGAA